MAEAAPGAPPTLLRLAGCSLFQFSPVEADSGGEPCVAEAASLHPEDGTVEAALTAPDPSIVLDGPDGHVDGSSELQPGDTLVVCTADDLVARGTTCSAILRLCTGDSNWSFETAQLH